MGFTALSPRNRGGRGTAFLRCREVQTSGEHTLQWHGIAASVVHPDAAGNAIVVRKHCVNQFHMNTHIGIHQRDQHSHALLSIGKGNREVSLKMVFPGLVCDRGILVDSLSDLPACGQPERLSGNLPCLQAVFRWETVKKIYGFSGQQIRCLRTKFQTQRTA